MRKNMNTLSNKQLDDICDIGWKVTSVVMFSFFFSAIIGTLLYFGALLTKSGLEPVGCRGSAVPFRKVGVSGPRS